MSQLSNIFNNLKQSGEKAFIPFMTTGDGGMDSCIVIRSAFVKNGTAYVQAGAGVVFDSDPQSEANETRAKAQAVITAIQSTYEAQ